MDDLVCLKTIPEQLGSIDREICQLCLEKTRLQMEYAERVKGIETRLDELRAEKYRIMRGDDSQ